LGSYYYNINYTCNSDCIFCASDNRLITADSLSYQQVVETFSRFQVGSGDRVILNGGEPTIHPDLLPIVQDAASRGAWVCLFSNGRKLSDPRLAQALVQAGVARVTIPLYGTAAVEHDSITRRPGSLDQTVRGIINLYTLQTSYPSLEIELKVLFCRPTAHRNPDIVSFIYSRFPALDRLVLSGLILSQAAMALAMRYTEFMEAVNETLSIALQYPAKIIIHRLPLCLIAPSLRTEYLQRNQSQPCGVSSEATPVSTYHYFDNMQPDGVELATHNVSKCHLKCDYRTCCTIAEDYVEKFGDSEFVPIIRQSTAD
jgi:sulfatase maturation enzyme AslB (radical SAM superfamily)